MKITVILLCWKRFEHFEDIIKFWLRQPKVDEIIVCDNSGKFKTDLPVLLFNISRNIGLTIRYLITQVAKNDVIIFCDDDANHQDGIIEDFFKYYNENKILGVMGLQYTTFYKTSTKIAGSVISKPTKVDYTPANTCMTHRKNCLVDISKCPHLLADDIWWQEEAKKINEKLSIWVVPTKKYSWYPESGDKYAIHKNPETYVVREKFFKKERLGFYS